MDAELVKWGASLGVGGILAGGMFAFYRRDSLTTKEQREALVAALTRHAIACERLATLQASNHEMNVATLSQIGHDIRNVLGDTKMLTREARERS